MKRILLLVALWFPFHKIFAQQSVYYFAEAGLGGGTHTSLKLAANVIVSDHDMVSFCYYFQSHHAANTPPDYMPGFTILDDGMPREYLRIVCPMYGRIVYHTDYCRIIMNGGLGVATVTYPSNFQPNNSGGWLYLGPNYTYDENKDQMLGVVLNPIVEFPFTRAFGLSFGLFSVITDRAISLGAEGNILLGKIRNRKMRHKNI